MSAQYIDELTRDFRLEVSKAALVVVDLQYASGSRHHGPGRHLEAQGRLAEAAYRFDRIEQLVLPNTARLLDGFRQVGARVIYLTLGSELSDYADAPLALRGFFEATNNHAGTREHEIVEAIAPRPGEPVVNKTTQGAFASPGMNSLLRSLGAEQLVMVGVSTNNCVETTAREAVDR
ncbi:MAG: cysteine hydrolase, partial [Kiloniellales bacterium]|nr:cysteine hydrolase [Kiloniellales bacterium]